MSWNSFEVDQANLRLASQMLGLEASPPLPSLEMDLKIHTLASVFATDSAIVLLQSRSREIAFSLPHSTLQASSMCTWSACWLVRDSSAVRLLSPLCSDKYLYKRFVSPL